VAIDYHANKHILLPLGGNSAARHDPDHNPRLASVYKQAQDTINAAGGIHGQRVQGGDSNIRLITADALNQTAAKAWESHGSKDVSVRRA
jgi:hypothetical protein